MLERPKSGWTRVAFGDVVRKVNDKVDPWESGLERYVAGEHMDTDDLRIRRWGVIGDDYLGPAFHMRFKPGHVLYGSRRTYLRKVALADFEGITANTTFVLEAKDPGTLMPELLPFLMQIEAFHSYSIKHSKGSVNPYVNFSDLEAFEFLLPPIQEQARFVEALSALRISFEALRAASEQLSVLKTSFVSQVINRTDVAARRIKVADLLMTTFLIQKVALSSWKWRRRRPAHLPFDPAISLRSEAMVTVPFADASVSAVKLTAIWSIRIC